VWRVIWQRLIHERAQVDEEIRILIEALLRSWPTTAPYVKGVPLHCAGSSAAERYSRP